MHNVKVGGLLYSVACPFPAQGYPYFFFRLFRIAIRHRPGIQGAQQNGTIRTS